MYKIKTGGKRSVKDYSNYIHVHLGVIVQNTVHTYVTTQNTPCKNYLRLRPTKTYFYLKIKNKSKQKTP